MTQIKDYLIVPVPEGDFEFKIGNALDGEPFLLMLTPIIHEVKGVEVVTSLRNYPGSWSIVEIDERVAHNIIDKKVKEYGEVWIYNDYVTGKALFTALESYSSLLKSKGYENVVLLKKK
jgi:hypothetical protein